VVNYFVFLHHIWFTSTDKVEKLAYSLAVCEEKAKAFGVKVSLIGEENVGKTSVVATLVGDPFQESSATKGVDLNITDTSNWKRITKTEVSQSLQTEFLKNLKTCTDIKKNATKDLSDLIDNDEVDTSTTEAEYIPPKQKIPIVDNEEIPTVDNEEIKKANSTAMKIIQNKKGKNVTILDYAGPATYHSTHPVFIRKENVIMVVFNASQLLSTNVKVRSSTLRPHPVTQNIHFWMNTVHSICSEPGNENDKASLLPVILLVATHIDLIRRSAEKAKEKIIQMLAIELEGKPYAQHLAGHREGLFNALRKYCIFLSNKHRDPMAIHQLQDAIVEVSSPILSREHPLVYLKIERDLLGISKGVITKEEFHEIAYSCGVLADIDSKEFAVALEYFQHHGTVMHFASIESLKDLVIVSPHWLTKLFSYVLIAHPYQSIGSAGGKEDNSFEILTKKGILLGSFLTYMLKLFNHSEQATGFVVNREQTVYLMKKFGFAAQIFPKAKFLEETRIATEKEMYIVPSLLPEDTTNQKQIHEENDKNVRVVYFHLPDGFLPPMLFDQMVTMCINRNKAKQEEILW